ncbi:hypothetical protein BJY52DRAFT_1287160 [Lactarius psammicola]|nr:hypothetical protein BJY52DRAFT_1287160 [Lactarius psammicola]
MQYRSSPSLCRTTSVDGYFAYVVLLSLVDFALCVTTQSPRDIWKHVSGEYFRDSSSNATNWQEIGNRDKEDRLVLR